LRKKNTSKGKKGPEAEMDPLTEFLREKARTFLQIAVEAEMEEFLQEWEGVRNLERKRTVVRNGYNPERTIQTGIGELSVRMPKVRDRSRNGVVFHSSLIPPYIRKSRSLSELVPLLYPTLRTLSGEKIAFFDSRPEEGENGSMDLLEIHQFFCDAPTGVHDLQKVDIVEQLKGSPDRQALGEFSQLVGKEGLRFFQGVPKELFGQGIDEEGQAHDHGESHDSAGSFEEEVFGKEKRIFEEPEAAFDRGSLLLVHGQHVGRGEGLGSFVGGQDKDPEAFYPGDDLVGLFLEGGRKTDHGLIGQRPVLGRPRLA